jgi:hypothetical protein
MIATATGCGLVSLLLVLGIAGAIFFGERIGKDKEWNNVLEDLPGVVKLGVIALPGALIAIAIFAVVLKSRRASDTLSIVGAVMLAAVAFFILFFVTCTAVLLGELSHIH